MIKVNTANISIVCLSDAKILIILILPNLYLLKVIGSKSPLPPQIEPDNKVLVENAVDELTYNILTKY